jgi:general secretion pathway protein D
MLSARLQSILNLLLFVAASLVLAGSLQAGRPPAQSVMRQGLQDLAEGPPELKPLSKSPINIKMANDAKIVYETLCKLAGLTVIFDSDFAARHIAVELTDLTIEQALDVVSLQAKAFWKPVTQNIVFVIPDQPQKRRDYEEQVVQTYYLSNAVFPQDLTDVVNGLRQVLDLRKIQQLNSQNAIIIRDTPDKLALAEKIIHDLDSARPEVVVQVEVLQVRRDKVHQLGIQPGSTASLTFSPPSSSSSSNTKAPLSDLGHLATNYSITLPGAVASALFSDDTSHLIQNPELRSVDGQAAKLRVGDRVPVATGSFQAGSSGSINPLVNTQFQYIDVGVNIDITPRIHPDHDISLKLAIEVSSVTGTATIGGIQQPIISQRKIEHDIRLKEGEVSILGGLFEQVDTKTLNGWPGLSHIPILRYLFSVESKEHQENEVLIVLVPRIVRLPAFLQADLRPVSSGSESFIQIRRKDALESPVALSSVTTGEDREAARFHFDAEDINLKVGQEISIGLIGENAKDLFSVPLLLQYDPQILSFEEVHHGDLLSGGTQEIAIVQRIDKERGQAMISLTRQPNTAGVSGTGVLASLTVRAIGAGSSKLSIVQVNAKNSQQKQIPVLTRDVTLHVHE